MHHHALIRAEQSRALQQSLGLSSLSALTLVVAALLAAQLVGRPRVTVEEPRIVDWPAPHDPGSYVPHAPGAPAVPEAFVPHAKIVETREESVPVVDPIPPVAVGDPFVGGGPGEAGTREGGVPPGSAGAVPLGTTIPPPTTYIFRDEEPVLVRKLLPAYPDLARQASMEGDVAVVVFVGVDGRVKRAEVEGRASVFDAAALEAVRQWVFTPAKAAGQPVGVWIRVPVLFRLR